MKKQLILFVGLLTLATSCANKTTLIEGHIIGYETFTENSEPAIIPSLNSEQYPLIMDDKGNFKVELEIDEPQYAAAIFIDMLLYRLYIEPGKKYNITIDYTTGKESDIVVSGNNEKENLIINRYYNHYGYLLDSFHQTPLPPTYAQYDALLASETAYFDELMPKTTAYCQMVVGDIIANSTNYFRYVYPYLYLEYYGVVPADADYDAFIGSDSWQKMSTSMAETVNNQIGYLSYAVPNTDMMEVVKLIYKLSPSKTLADNNATAVVKMLLSGQGKGDLHKVYEYYISKCSDDTLKAEISKGYQDVCSALPGSMGAEFEMEDIEGNVFKFSDLKGKITYIDVWATWCGPCCKEIPYLEQLVEKYKNNNKVQFVSISIDDDRGSWEKFITKDKPQWAQYIIENSGESPLCTVYRIEGIPRFLIFDAEGRVVSTNTSRPSDPATITMIDKLLRNTK